ncbi:hypothetical protein P3T35_006364 [Kitasatospora sp. GP30]|uniref:hypothetical protein n=1 Tax=Kitasatospora sp. GP30 TaxID=3035084 RepID=UPI000CB098C6|nr:hypothetical protein [Kitasatospora sp. GP30]MDH6144322.1 hypothetical protein [Kitasatospora sp. GP30]
MNDRSASQATVGATVHLMQPDGSAGPALAPGFLRKFRKSSTGSPHPHLLVRVRLRP